MARSSLFRWPSIQLAEISLAMHITKLELADGFAQFNGTEYLTYPRVALEETTCTYELADNIEKL